MKFTRIAAIALMATSMTSIAAFAQSTNTMQTGSNVPVFNAGLCETSHSWNCF